MDVLVFGTASDPLLAAAQWTAFGALLATTAVLIAVAILRVRLLRNLARERRLAALWNPLLAQCAGGVPDALPPLRPAEAECFLLLWCHAQESLRGEAQAHLRDMALRLRVAERIGPALRSRRMDRRLLAVVAVGHLRMREHGPWLHTLIASAPPAVSITAARALMRIDANICVPPLLAATARRDDWPLAAVGSILRDCDPQVVGPMLAGTIRAALGAGDPEAAARLLRLHVAARPEDLHDAVRDVLATSDAPETLAAALAALRSPHDVGHARRLLEHPEWFVRVAAARAIGRLGSQEDAARLATALADSSWWVRYRAGQALCSLPGMGAAELATLAAQLTDRFAADMLRHVMAERVPA